MRNQRIQACGDADERNVGATRQGTGDDPFTASEARGRLPVGRATVARRPPHVQGRTQTAPGRPGAVSRTPWLYGVVVVVPVVVAGAVVVVSTVVVVESVVVVVVPVVVPPEAAAPHVPDGSWSQTSPLAIR